MSNLSYRTRGNSNPRGKERVYFTCHPADFKAHFEPICEDIFQTQNCAIWYRADLEEDKNLENAQLPEELALELGRMQLFVIPITSRFLYQPNRARDMDFKFAVEHHIPVLPLMQEEGLENEFNRICGDLQFLDRQACENDPTARPYDDKLETFLNSVLLGEELTEKIRAAFDAYVFLSYRKKDRKYAQELMHLIHKNDFCRDIAIWYDEFLIPGESFNDAIEAAIKKSSLFALLVTPNLVNEENYVMSVEYPMALQTGKPIIPAEAVPTDRKKLTEEYAGITECTDAHDAEALGEALRRNCREIALKETNQSAEHLFFIGLAYLNGIDMEVNTEKALELICSAADTGLDEAAEKLETMYRNGIGVERNYETSLHWSEKRVEILKRRLEETDDPQIGDQLFSMMMKNAQEWFDMRRLEQAEMGFRSLGDLLGKLQDRYGDSRYEVEGGEMLPRKYSYPIMLSRVYNMLADCFLLRQEMEEESVWRKASIEVMEVKYRESIPELQVHFPKEKEDVLFALEDAWWSEICDWYELTISEYEEEEMWDEMHAWEQRWEEAKKIRFDFGASNSQKGAMTEIKYDDLLVASRYEPYSDELLKRMEAHVHQLEENYRITKELEIRYEISEYYAAMKRMRRRQYEAEEDEYRRRKRELLSEVNRCHEAWHKYYSQVITLWKTQEDCRKKSEENTEDAAEWARRAEEYSQQMMEAKVLSDEWYQKMEDAEQQVDQHILQQLEAEWKSKNWEKLLSEWEDNWEKKIWQWDEETRELLLEYAPQAERMYEKEKTGKALDKLIAACDRLGELLRKAGDISTAFVWYRKKLTLEEERYAQTQKIDDYDRLADTCRTLGMLDEEHPDREMLERALKIMRELYQYSHSSAFSERVKELEEILERLENVSI